ncbi:hypothetical protein FC65_GL001353 [Ligilactobacillus acidipiscis DSM 15836]|uniref:Uncharacterized protein n=1 Tax=Ligilactobacillus acidipiscis DSM 15836 TaxID=1423716 RepID=A0ABR5PH25_9LACO|nr:hypothetical protein FC65_GL001353 [Ligilactobacillus acidipiscis DSM 15836]
MVTVSVDLSISYFVNATNLTILSPSSFLALILKSLSYTFSKSSINRPLWFLYWLKYFNCVNENEISLVPLSMILEAMEKNKFISRELKRRNGMEFSRLSYFTSSFTI